MTPAIHVRAPFTKPPHVKHLKKKKSSQRKNEPKNKKIKVLGENCGESGPQGVTLSLVKGVQTIKTTTSDDSGNYVFPNVFPGSYELVASHPSLTLKNNRHQVSVNWDNLVVKTPFVVGGFDISGTVNSAGEPAQNIVFLLFSNEVKSLNCTAPNIQGIPLLDKFDTFEIKTRFSKLHSFFPFLETF